MGSAAPLETLQTCTPLSAHEEPGPEGTMMNKTLASIPRSLQISTKDRSADNYGPVCVLTGEGEGQGGREEGDPKPGWDERVKEK